MSRARDDKQQDTIRQLARLTEAAYRDLENGSESEQVYPGLFAAYAAHGLDADVAESSIDWYEFGVPVLIESLEYALTPRRRAA